MTTAELRKVVSARPFRTLEISLENGDRHTIKHPEWISVGTSWVMIEFPDTGLVIFEAADITSVRLAPRNGRKR